MPTISFYFTMVLCRNAVILGNELSPICTKPKVCASICIIYSDDYDFLRQDCGNLICPHTQSFQLKTSTYSSHGAETGLACFHIHFHTSSYLRSFSLHFQSVWEFVSTALICIVSILLITIL